MPSFECDSCGKRHRQYDRWLECQEKKVRSTCGCPDYWKRRWDDHSYQGCPLRTKGEPTE